MHTYTLNNCNILKYIKLKLKLLIIMIVMIVIIIMTMVIIIISKIILTKKV